MEPVIAVTSEEAYRRFAENVDFLSPQRSDWRNAALGDRRAPLQRFLLEMAEAARISTSAAQLALYKAAHAVLPLHGHALAELAERLLAEGDVPLEWCDVLVLALIEEVTSVKIPYLNALRSACEKAEDAPLVNLRVRIYLQQVAAAVPPPTWLRERLLALTISSHPTTPHSP